MERDLIYDVGMHNGDDTAFYLHRGYRVVAIEADPVQAEAGFGRFKTAIAQDRLIILNVAISPQPGTVQFWISSNPEYNSLSKEKACSSDNTCHSIEVHSRPFASILAEYGVPYYLKVDIEGADYLCMEAIDPEDPPHHLSFEKNDLDQLLLCRKKGYSFFKLIAQENFQQLNYPPRGGLIASRLQSKMRKLSERVIRSFEKVMHRRAIEPDWTFVYGSSGPFGEETDGPWRKLEEVAFTWLAFDLGHTGASDPKWEDWFDVHCKR
jgi:FkbM family methyltransferase